MADHTGWRERRARKLTLKSERLRILDVSALDGDQLAHVVGGCKLGRNVSRYCITGW